MALAAAVLSSIVAACGGDADSSVTADDLDGRTFVATSFEPDGIVEGSEITVDFAGGGLSVSAGCNVQNGGYSIDGGSLEVDAMTSTLMGCPEALMAQDDRIVTLLSSSPSVTLDGDTLVIDGDGTLVLTER